LGGWLVLEDWFFSGTSGRHVMSERKAGQGTCLPPLLHGLEKHPWQSEGLLTKYLQDSRGGEEAVQIITAHRKEYIGDYSDLQKIASLGIRSVRLPMPWSAFADALSPIDASVYSSGAKIVPDPFYRDKVVFVTVHRDVWLKEFLRQAAHHKLKVVLDLHHMPGGANDGTYNGIWPLQPKFWTSSVKTQNGRSVKLTEVGLWIAGAFVKWVEQLDPSELSVVEGVTLLNEPAHMAAVDKDNGHPYTKSEKQVLDWVSEMAGLFRQSTLPGKGVKLYVNMAEPAFDNFWETVAPWYMETFTKQERHSWAVFDIHWYTAWGGEKCSGRTAPGGKYRCGQAVEEVRPMLKKCIEDDLAKFTRKVDGLKACSEFSLATFEDPTKGCDDRAGLLSIFLEEQLKAFTHHKVESFFWSWKMPDATNFEYAWSFKHIAGLGH
jgi:hypothetical protein